MASERDSIAKELRASVREAAEKVRGPGVSRRDLMKGSIALGSAAMLTGLSDEAVAKTLTAKPPKGFRPMAVPGKIVKVEKKGDKLLHVTGDLDQRAARAESGIQRAERVRARIGELVERALQRCGAHAQRIDLAVAQPGRATEDDGDA